MLYSLPVKPPFSRRVPWPAEPNALSSLLAERRRAGLPILNFAESNPTRVGLARDGGALLGALAVEASLRYAPEPRGLPGPREALAAFYAGRGTLPLARGPAASETAAWGEAASGAAASRTANGAAASGTAGPPAGDAEAAGPLLGPDRFFLCASTSEAYGWLFKLLCEPGEAVLVPKPGYPLFDYLAGLEGVEARPYRLEYFHPKGWRIDLESLEAALAAGRARAVVLINPNNPTGSYVGAEERRAVVELAARHGAALVVDEVFFGFPLEAESASSFAGEEGVLTFVLDGLSKLLGLPQMKLGWIAASGPAPELAEALGRLEIVADTYLSAGTPIQNALPAYLEAAPAFQADLGARLKANLRALRLALEGPESPHRVLRCDGGWSALLEAPRLLPEEEMAAGLLREEGLQTHPGYFFDMEREAHFMASLILPPGDLAEAARRYKAYFERLLG